MGLNDGKNFAEIVQEVAVENPEALKFSERGGILYMYGDKPGAKKSTGSESEDGTAVGEGAETV